MREAFFTTLLVVVQFLHIIHPKKFTAIKKEKLIEIILGTLLIKTFIRPHKLIN